MICLIKHPPQPHPPLPHYPPIYYPIYAAKLWFGSCQTRVWQLPNSGLAAAKLGFGGCQTQFGSCKTQLAAAYELKMKQNHTTELLGYPISKNNLKTI